MAHPAPAIRILPGARGADKLYWSAPPPTHPAAPTSLVLFFGGDAIDDPAAHPDVHRLQAPAEVARLCRARFGPGAAVIQVAPSRHEAGFACFDHFLGATTRSGEPLGYGARVPAGGGAIPMLGTWVRARLGVSVPCTVDAAPRMRCLPGAAHRRSACVRAFACG